MESQDPGVYRSRRGREFSATRRPSRPRMPSTSGYMVAAGATAGALFFVLWWMLQGEENPWVPAGLAASVVMLVAASAREVVVRRAWTRHILDQDNRVRREHQEIKRAPRPVNMQTESLHSGALRALQKQSAEADAHDAGPETHRELYQLCADYLASAEAAVRGAALTVEARLALQTGQEKARAMQKHHLLTWARGSALSLTREAQQRVRIYDRVETAHRALECIDSALKVYPDEDELNRSATAVREFIASSRVAHWVELAERAAFKGYYRRAIDCYRDALFYLTRDNPDRAQETAAERIAREIELLRARLDTHRAVDEPLDRDAGERRNRPGQ